MYKYILIIACCASTPVYAMDADFFDMDSNVKWSDVDSDSDSEEEETTTQPCIKADPADKKALKALIKWINDRYQALVNQARNIAQNRTCTHYPNLIRIFPQLAEKDQKEILQLLET